MSHSEAKKLYQELLLATQNITSKSRILTSTKELSTENRILRLKITPATCRHNKNLLDFTENNTRRPKSKRKITKPTVKVTKRRHPNKGVSISGAVVSRKIRDGDFVPSNFGSSSLRSYDLEIGYKCFAFEIVASLLGTYLDLFWKIVVQKLHCKELGRPHSAKASLRWPSQLQCSFKIFTLLFEKEYSDMLNCKELGRAHSDFVLVALTFAICSIAYQKIRDGTFGTSDK